MFTKSRSQKARKAKTRLAAVLEVEEKRIYGGVAPETLQVTNQELFLRSFWKKLRASEQIDAMDFTTSLDLNPMKYWIGRCELHHSALFSLVMTTERLGVLVELIFQDMLPWICLRTQEKMKKKTLKGPYLRKAKNCQTSEKQSQASQSRDHSQSAYRAPGTSWTPTAC